MPRNTIGSAEDRILDATLSVLAHSGVAGVSFRAVAREAGVATGLAGYYFENKSGLIAASLKRIGEQDLLLVAPAPDGTDPKQHLRDCIHRAVDPEFLASDYLSLRLQLWSLAGVDEAYADINKSAQQRYLEGLVDLILAARDDLNESDASIRAGDILIIQNGIWLTSALIEDPAAIQRALESCLTLALD